jgi:hypothetical protein
MQKTFQPGGKETRSFTFARASADTKARTVELSFSSEEPIERSWGIEILDHKSKSVRLDSLRLVVRYWCAIQDCGRLFSMRKIIPLIRQAKTGFFHP